MKWKKITLHYVCVCVCKKIVIRIWFICCTCVCVYVCQCTCWIKVTSVVEEKKAHNVFCEKKNCIMHAYFLHWRKMNEKCFFYKWHYHEPLTITLFIYVVSGFNTLSLYIWRNEEICAACNVFALQIPKNKRDKSQIFLTIEKN